MGRRIMMGEVRREGKKKALNSGSQLGQNRRLFVRAKMIRILLAVTVLTIMNVGITLADDQPIFSSAIGYQNGTITAIHEKTLDINGRSYGLIPDVVLLTDRGRAMSLGDLVMTAEVKFHVTKEDGNKIDKMIVTLPR
jgi:hypothetical protein